MSLRSLWSALRLPTATPGRRFSYHRLLLVLSVEVWLYLWRPAIPGETVDEWSRRIATVAVAVGLAGLMLPPMLCRAAQWARGEKGSRT